MSCCLRARLRAEAPAEGLLARGGRLLLRVPSARPSWTPLTAICLFISRTAHSMPARGRTPLAVSFVVLPSAHAPPNDLRPSAFLASTLLGLPILRSLDPSPAGEPLVSSSLLLLALGRPPSDAWTLLRDPDPRASLSLSSDAAPVELDLAGRAPFDADVWLPLATARAVAKALGVDDLLAGLLSWRTRRCASWLEPGGILAHKWVHPALLGRRVARELGATRCSTD